MTDTYNGWANYETWRVNMEIFDGIDYRDFFSNSNEYELSKELAQYAYEVLEMSGQGIALDYAIGFLGKVDFQEIARNMIEEYIKRV